MPDDARQRQRIAERCWQVYALINDKFTPSPEIHLEFPERAELAVLSGALQVRVTIPPGYILEILEEYNLHEHELVIAHYSYVLLQGKRTPILRADPLPHHRVDYRRRKLTHFPHHLHGERGRIRSFTGRLEDFLLQAAALAKRPG